MISITSCLIKVTVEDNTNLKHVHAASEDLRSQIQVDRPRQEGVLRVDDVLLDGTAETQGSDVEGFLLGERVFPAKEKKLK